MAEPISATAAARVLLTGFKLVKGFGRRDFGKIVQRQSEQIKAFRKTLTPGDLAREAKTIRQKRIGAITEPRTRLALQEPVTPQPVDPKGPAPEGPAAKKTAEPPKPKPPAGTKTFPSEGAGSRLGKILSRSAIITVGIELGRILLPDEVTDPTSDDIKELEKTPEDIERDEQQRRDRSAEDVMEEESVLRNIPLGSLGFPSDRIGPRDTTQPRGTGPTQGPPKPPPPVEIAEIDPKTIPARRTATAPPKIAPPGLLRQAIPVLVGVGVGVLPSLLTRTPRGPTITLAPEFPPAPTPTPTPTPGPTPPSPAPISPGGFQLDPVLSPSFVRSLSRASTRARTDDDECQIVERRRRRKGVCREGFFVERPGSTKFTTWRTKDCLTGKTITEI